MWSHSPLIDTPMLDVKMYVLTNVELRDLNQKTGNLSKGVNPRNAGYSFEEALLYGRTEASPGLNLTRTTRESGA